MTEETTSKVCKNCRWHDTLEHGYVAHVCYREHEMDEVAPDDTCEHWEGEKDD